MDRSRTVQYLDFLTTKSFILTLLISCVMLLIFVADLQFTTEVFMGVLYLIVIMLSLWLPSTKYSLGFAIICTVLIAYGYFSSIYNFNVAQYMNITGFLNLGMTICALWITTIIAMHIKTISANLKISESIHRAILAASIDPIISINKDGIIESASNSVENTFGWTASELKGQSFDKLLSVNCRAPYTKLFSHNLNVASSQLVGQQHEAVGLHRLKRDFACELSINLIKIEEIDKIFFTAVLRDITARKAAEQKICWLSVHDELTKIYNRRYFNEHIDREWRRLFRSQECLSVIMVDVDYFKKYNDALGHQIGDNCLQSLALAMQLSMHRSTDFVARYGGEEFIVLLPGTELEGAIKVAENLQEKISNLNMPHPSSMVSKKVTVSMGVAAMIPSAGTNYETLIRRADQALYEAKETGRNRLFVSKA